MGNVDLGRFTITFPRPLSHDREVPRFLDDLASHLGPESQVSYFPSSRENIVPERDPDGRGSGAHVRDPGSTALSGNVQQVYTDASGTSVGSTGFSLTRGAGTHHREYDTFLAETVSGWSLHDYHPFTLRLIDEIRAYVPNWFASNPDNQDRAPVSDPEEEIPF